MNYKQEGDVGRKEGSEHREARKIEVREEGGGGEVLRRGGGGALRKGGVSRKSPSTKHNTTSTPLPIRNHQVLKHHIQPTSEHKGAPPQQSRQCMPPQAYGNRNVCLAADSTHTRATPSQYMNPQPPKRT